MSKKTSKQKLGKELDYKKLLKYDSIENLNWFEEELNELYLDKNKYKQAEIKNAKHIIQKIEDLKELCVDRQLYYLIERTTKKIRNIYPEFFDS